MIYGNGLRKISKKDPISASLLRTPPELMGSVYFYGKIGSGKTVSLLSFAGLYHDNTQRNYKIIDLWGGDRNENLYWGLPSDKKSYWTFAKKYLKLDGDGPKQYKVEYLYPLTKKLIARKKLPFNPPHVTSKFFTIDLKDMTNQDFPLVIGTMSQSSIGTWNNIIDDCKKSYSVPKIIDKYKSEVTKKDLLYNSVLKPISNELLFQDSLCTSNLNSKEISKMLDDKETVTVLCLDFIKDEYKLLVVGYLLRKICDELDRRRRKVIGLFREVSIFFRVDDKSIAPERIKVMKSYLTQWIQMGRRGLHLFLDVQSISDTRNIVGGQQDLTLFGKMPDESDRRAASEQLYRDGLITKKQITSIASLAPGQFVFSPSGGKCSTNYVLLPKCRYWEEKNGSFYNNIWEREVGRWIGFEEEINKLQEKRKSDLEILEEEKKNKKDKNKTNINEVNIRDRMKVDEVKEEEILKIIKPKPKANMGDFF